MFVLAKSVNYFWPVSISLPKSGGTFDKSTFEIEFKRVTASRVKEVIAKAEADELNDAMLCKEIIVGWKGVTDEGGEPIPFSSSALEELIEIPTVANKIVLAYFESMRGAPRKN